MDHPSTRLTRRRFIGSACTAGAAVLLSGPRRAGAADDAVAWHDVSEWGVEGRGWSEVKAFYDRLPARAESIVRPPVWGLSQDSAGMSTLFKTDSPSISIRYTLRKPLLALPHMPATGVSGVDLYGRTELGDWRWIATPRPTSQDVEAVLTGGLAPGLRDYKVYLPLYNGVERVEVGVLRDAAFTSVAPRADKPLVFYGTSIMQGACASRPGMAMTGILERRIGVPTINLGFSGNGPMDPEMPDFLGELDAAVFIIDSLPNMNAAMVEQRAVPFIQKLRAHRPKTPIVLAEDRVGPHSPLVPAQREFHAANHAALREAYDTLLSQGVTGIRYVTGERFLGADGEDTVDGSHPTDLGMLRYADAYEPVIRGALGDA